MKTRRNTSFRISNNWVGEFIIRSGSKNTLDWRTDIWFFFIFVLMEKYYSTNCPINTTTIIKTIIVAMLFIIAAIIVFASGGYWLGISIILLLLVIMVVTYFVFLGKLLWPIRILCFIIMDLKEKFPSAIYWKQEASLHRTEMVCGVSLQLKVFGGIVVFMLQKYTRTFISMLLKIRTGFWLKLKERIILYHRKIWI